MRKTRNKIIVNGPHSVTGAKWRMKIKTGLYHGLSMDMGFLMPIAQYEYCYYYHYY